MCRYVFAGRTRVYERRGHQRDKTHQTVKKAQLRQRVTYLLKNFRTSCKLCTCSEKRVKTGNNSINRLLYAIHSNDAMFPELQCCRRSKVRRPNDHSHKMSTAQTFSINVTSQEKRVA